MLKQYKQQNRFIGAICASPAVVLEPLGLLEGEHATCYPSHQNMLKDQSKIKQKVVVSNKTSKYFSRVNSLVSHKSRPRHCDAIRD